jgi:DNA-binding NtrC family response regulator
VRTLIRKLARAGDSTVLVTGPSGTGKDLAARALHAASPRAARPFVNVTCTALPSTLLESELFGHERGAFTDAKTRRRGLFEQAEGGTLFLDEIGDMDPLLQAKLLRVLEDKRYRRVGGDEDRVADVRIVAATHTDLPAAVATGRFRQDLYYRLAVLVVRMPALRERREDIEALVRHFLGIYGARAGRGPLRVSAAALDALRAYDWPGNVRELRNVIERGMILCETDMLEAVDLEPARWPAREAGTFALPGGGVDMHELERDLLLQALERTHGNVTHAARLLGMSRDQVRYRIQKLALEPCAVGAPPRWASQQRLGQTRPGDQRRELDPRDRRRDGGDARERPEPAVGAGDHALGPHAADEALDPLGHELGVLDVVGRGIDDSGHQDLARRYP